MEGVNVLRDVRLVVTTNGQRLAIEPFRCKSDILFELPLNEGDLAKDSKKMGFLYEMELYYF
jgi:hypothetical protein